MRAWMRMIVLLVMCVPAAGQSLTAADFVCYMNRFAAGESYANCDGSTGTPALTANDFQCFINAYVAGESYANCDGSGPVTQWTNLAAPPGARIVYLAPQSGSDGADGLSPASAKRTWNAAYALVRDGQPDQLLSKAGETLVITGTLSMTKASAMAGGQYMVIGSYGATAASPRARFLGSIQTLVNGESIGKRGLAFSGIDFEGTRTVDSRALRFLGWDDVLIENCAIHDFHRGVINQGFNTRSDRFRFRNNVVYDMVSPSCIGTNCPQGMYIDATDDWLIEGNYFDMCGLPGSMYSRPVYLQDDCGRGTFTGNVMARSPAEGVQVRAGGIVTDNLSLRNPIGMYVGHNGEGVNRIERNVVLESGDIGPGQERGRGAHLNGPSEVRRNVVAYNTGRGWGAVHGFYCQSASGTLAFNYVYEWTRSPGDGGPGPTDEAQSILCDGGAWVIEGNQVYAARQGIVLQPGGASITGGGNVFAEPAGGQATFRPWATFAGWVLVPMVVDPHLREALPGGGIDAYCALIRGQSRATWREDLTAAIVTAVMRQRVGV